MLNIGLLGKEGTGVFDRSLRLIKEYNDERGYDVLCSDEPQGKIPDEWYLTIGLQHNFNTPELVFVNVGAPVAGIMTRYLVDNYLREGIELEVEKDYMVEFDTEYRFKCGTLQTLPQSAFTFKLKPIDILARSLKHRFSSIAAINKRLFGINETKFYQILFMFDGPVCKEYPDEASEIRLRLLFDLQTRVEAYTPTNDDN